MKQIHELHVEYNPDLGEPIRDGDISDYLDEIVEYLSDPESESGRILYTSSELVVNEVRIRIKQGQLDTALTAIYYRAGEVLISSSGRFIDLPPKGFCEVYEKQLDKLLDLDKGEY